MNERLALFRAFALHQLAEAHERRYRVNCVEALQHIERLAPDIAAGAAGAGWADPQPVDPAGDLLEFLARVFAREPDAPIGAARRYVREVNPGLARESDAAREGHR